MRQKLSVRKKMLKFWGLKNKAKWQPANRFQKIASILFIVIFAGAGVYLLLQSFAAPPPRHQPWKNDDIAIIRQVNEQLKALDRGLRFNPKSQSQLASQVGPLAKQRKAILLGLMKTKPQQAADLLLPDFALENLRPVRNKNIEKKVSLSGIYSIEHYHHPKTGGGEDEGFNYFVTTKDGIKHPIYTNGLIRSISPRSVIKVTGYQLDEVMFAYAAGSAGLASMEVTQAAAVVPTLGPIKVAVILVNFANSTTSLDPNKATSIFSGSPGQDVDSYFKESSYNLSTMSASVFGPYRSAINLGADGACPLPPPADEVINLANADVDYTKYQRVAIVYNCSYGASGGVGLGQYVTPDGTITLGFDHFGADKYNASIEEARKVFAHELAHNLGYSHAGYFDCGAVAFIAPTNFDENCATSEYGDNFDILGNFDTKIGHLNPFHKSGPGWLNSTQLVNVTTPGTYTYTLAPYESVANSPMALNIPRGNSKTSFTVEYRQPTGFDSYLADGSLCNDCNITKGASVRLSDYFVASVKGGGSDTEFIDMTPGTQSGEQVISDGALVPGKTFTDTEYGISITAVSANSSGLTVQVNVPNAATCTRNSPTVSLTSASPN